MKIINVDGKKYNAEEMSLNGLIEIDGRYFTNIMYAIHFYVINYINFIPAKILNLPFDVLKKAFDEKMNNNQFMAYLKTKKIKIQ